MNILNLMSPDKINWGSIELIDFSSFIELLIRFSLNLVVVLILVRWLYFSTTRRKDFLFTYILIASIIFLLCYLLANVKLQLGFALGLFAIFGIIRYRTDAMPIREMTYLFLVIGISIINALADTKTNVAEIIFSNLVVVLIAYGFEKVWLLRHESSRIIVYEKIDLIKPEKHDELIKDLEERTGIKKIIKVEIGKIDFLKDTCLLTIHYEETGNSNNVSGKMENDKDDDDDD
ncbi:MAG: DUF4956 domain-containing protein [Bacteroidia bacterium]|nr:DUF4956 domain-containing protein [Bacteroidia bacterium]